MKNLMIVALSVALMSCAEPDFMEAPEKYACSETQIAKVERETSFCRLNTTLSGVYCYGSGIMRNCEKIKARD
jgi:hypothetical protein